jgi:hypothetical protein
MAERPATLKRIRRSKVPNRRNQAPALKAGQALGGWTLVDRIGGGGNGVVWRVSKVGLPDHAIKVLKKIDATSLARFKAEVEALTLAKDIPGIIPAGEPPAR